MSTRMGKCLGPLACADAILGGRTRDRQLQDETTPVFAAGSFRHAPPGGHLASPASRQRLSHFLTVHGRCGSVFVPKPLGHIPPWTGILAVRNVSVNN